MAYFDSSVLIKREHFEHFHPMKMEHHSNCHSGNIKPDYICLGNGCFVCERASIQASPGNANWKKKVQNSLVAYQMQHIPDQTLCGGSFNLDSLRQLKPAESEKTKPFYIYDEKLGRKRRHDPWFAQHKVGRGDSPPAKRPDPRRKRMKSDCEDNQFQFHAPFLFDRCLKTEPSSNNNFLTPSPNSSPSLSVQSTTIQPATQTEEDQCTLSNNNNGEICISNLMPLLSLNNLDFFPNANQNLNNGNSENIINANDNAKIDIEAAIGALTGSAHGLDEYEWIMGVLAE